MKWWSWNEPSIVDDKSSSSEDAMSSRSCSAFHISSRDRIRQRIQVAAPTGTTTNKQTNSQTDATQHNTTQHNTTQKWTNWMMQVSCQKLHSIWFHVTLQQYGMADGWWLVVHGLWHWWHVWLGKAQIDSGVRQWPTVCHLFRHSDVN